MVEEQCVAREVNEDGGVVSRRKNKVCVSLEEKSARFDAYMKKGWWARLHSILLNGAVKADMDDAGFGESVFPYLDSEFRGERSEAREDG